MSKKLSLKSQVIIDLFASPVAVIPIAVGLTATLFSWAFGGQSTLGFYGILTALAGVGAGATRFFLFKDEIIEKAFNTLDTLKEKEKQKELDDLDSRLIKDKDSRTQSALREIRALYILFHEQLRLKVLEADEQTQEGIEKLFSECVSYLEQTLVFQKTIKALKDKKARKPIVEAREKLIIEVQEAVGRLASIIDGLRKNSVEVDTSEIKRISEELEQSLEISKKVNEQLGKIERQDYSWLKNRIKENSHE